MRRGGGGSPCRFSCAFESAALPTLSLTTALSHCKHKLVYSCFILGLFGTPPPLGPPLPPAAGELAAAAAGSAAAAASPAASLVCALRVGRRSWWSCGDEQSWSMHSDRVDDEAEEVGDGLGCLILMFDYSF